MWTGRHRFRAHHLQPDDPGTSPAESPWEFNYACTPRCSPFWTCRSLPSAVRSTRRLDRECPARTRLRPIRLLELTFPPRSRSHECGEQFDKAKIAFDQRIWATASWNAAGCSLCGRNSSVTRTTWWQTSQRVAGRGHPRDLLDNALEGVGTFANAPHHPEGDRQCGTLSTQETHVSSCCNATLSSMWQREADREAFEP